MPVNPPVASLLTSAGVVLVMLIPSTHNVILDDGAKLIPVILIDVPLGPLVGVSADTGLTVNVEADELVPSDTVIVFGPPVVGAGTLNVVTNPPVLLDLAAGVVETVVAPNFIVIVFSGIKPIPVTLTGFPTTPLVALVVNDEGIVVAFTGGVDNDDVPATFVALIS